MSAERQAAGTVFADASDEYGSVAAVLLRLRAWQQHQPGAYRDAYMAVSAPAIFAPFVRLQLLAWNPLWGGASGARLDAIPNPSTLLLQHVRFKEQSREVETSEGPSYFEACDRWKSGYLPELTCRTACSHASFSAARFATTQSAPLQLIPCSSPDSLPHMWIAALRTT